jgi:hypothetical protein
MANGEWYYARGNQQQGPVTLPAVQDLIRSGQLQPTDLVWRQGMANWQPASQVPEVAADLGSIPAPPPSTYPPPPPQYPPAGQYAPHMGSPLPYGQPVGYQQPYMGQHVPNYLVQAILVTLFCCLPFGIVSIVYAAQVNSKLAAGDYAGALDASQKAKTWSLWSFGIGLVFGLAYFGLIILGAAMDQGR